MGKSSVARAALKRLDVEGLVTVRVALDEYPTPAAAAAVLLEESRGHPYCTMLLAKQTAQLALPFGATSTSVVRLALPTVEKHDAWKKLR